MTKDEALKMAIEALEMHVPHYIKDRGCDALIACKEALEQPTQEPVGWLDANEMLADFMHKDLKAEHEKRGSFTPKDFPIPVYLHPHQWQKLTDDEVSEIIGNLNSPYAMIRTAEMMLEKRNHG